VHEVYKRFTKSRKTERKKRLGLLLSVIDVGRSMWCAGSEA
jgi:hypothetical protein